MSKYKFKAICAKQASGHQVFVFAASAHDVLNFAEIERVGRRDDGELKGFQRHQIASHIKEIRDYLAREDALLPNAVIVAFIDGVEIIELSDGFIEVHIDAECKKPGFVVDGQQRLSALAGLEKPNFEVFVSCVVCKDYNELRQQFVLINNTRPLPKTLIYELLPNVDGLPERFTSRKFASKMVDLLNFSASSSLLGEIKQHTNPSGMISDAAMQKLIMNSSSDGALRTFFQYEERDQKSFDLVNNYFAAVKIVFGPEWIGLAPRISRLRHGAGIVAMGFVMDYLYSIGQSSTQEFEASLKLLKPHTAWTSGQWALGTFDVRPWNGIQNTPSDIDMLTRYLVRTIKSLLDN